MNISLFGLGYVGAVTATCFAELGHRVTGVDVNRGKVDLINDGKAPVVEPELQDRIAAVVEGGMLSATQDAAAAILSSDVSIVCVGTPSDGSGGVSLDAVEEVMAQIGTALRSKGGSHAVVIRSTVPPGTTESRLVPILEAESRRRIGDELELCCNPEFLREGSALRDFYHAPFNIVGSVSENGPLLVEEIYRDVQAPVIRTSCGIAEAVKYVSNTYHALKITFANEVGSLLKAKGIDSRRVTEVFCQDRQLNLSGAYLLPGFAFGGSCLPKDTRALVRLGRTSDVKLPLLEQILVSNEAHLERAYKLISGNGRRSVALFGLAFKPNTDDLRESPLVALAERLIGKGYPIRIFDRHVQLSRLTGKNRDFIEREIPHLESLMAPSPESAMDGMEIIVVGHAGSGEIAAIEKHYDGQLIVDLAGSGSLQRVGGESYHGICW
ncbi:nucleotide sugar dehydrogenase [Methylobacterium nigriterrae]|uniref:nucleotide sugar dehydrogenase n=1 Tax=Methylobacterium nigriterrae TaxID=3127512 RepID=UPI0030139B3A